MSRRSVVKARVGPRLLAPVVVSLLVLVSCEATTDDQTTSTTEVDLPTPTAPVSSTSTPLSPEDDESAQYRADVELIEELWKGHNQAWLAGLDEGVRFWADNNYPDMGCTPDDYMASRFPDGPEEGLVIERLPNLPTVAADEGWAIPGGRLEGSVARGRVYTMSVQSSRTSAEEPIAEPVILDLHVTILDGRAHFFFGCS